jgi:hypothetical protein
MGKKPDLLWIAALVVIMGIASTSLIGEAEPQRMAPQQAGIMVR